MIPSPADTNSAAGAALQEHSVKVAARQAAVVSARTWEHAFGVMLIETCADGSVWIDGKPVPETLPPVLAECSKDPASTSGDSGV